MLKFSSSEELIVVVPSISERGSNEGESQVDQT